jgi:aspartyl-tRNA(Asn)/glutamyl-tRNA(Gln) amidotransferase subunit A
MVILSLKGGVKVSNILHLSNLLAHKKISSVELTKQYLSAIRKINPSINAYINITEETAIAQAKKADDLRDTLGGNAPVLLGIPMALKDNLAVRGLNTTCCSKALENFKSTYTATAVQKLFDSGAVLLGKTNMDEFAMGSYTNTGIYGATFNPYDTTKSSGGSSGGSAAAVASKIAAYTLGTDTAGSARQPASFCGVVGYKPTYGTVSRYGAIALASSFDQISPIANSVKDCAIIYDTIKGFDINDMTTIKQIYAPCLDKIDGNVKNVKIGIVNELFENCSKDITDSLHQAIEMYRKLGAEIVDVKVPHIEFALPVYYILGCAEISSNFGRYDGIRYGYKTTKPYKDVDDFIAKTRSESFGDDVKRRIMLGIYFLSQNNFNEYFLKAIQLRNELVSDFDEAFKQCDLILSPTTPTTATSFDYNPENVVDKYKADICVVMTNVCGLPAVSIPCGKDKLGLPIGMQLMGAKNSDCKVLNAAFAFETNSDLKLDPGLGGVTYDI